MICILNTQYIYNTGNLTFTQPSLEVLPPVAWVLTTSGLGQFLHFSRTCKNQHLFTRKLLRIPKVYI